MHAQSSPILCNLVDNSPSGSGPWGSPGKNTGVDCHALLQGIFPIQEIKPRSPALQAESLPTEHQGSPRVLLLLWLLVHFVCEKWKCIKCYIQKEEVSPLTFCKYFNMWSTASSPSSCSLTNCGPSILWGLLSTPGEPRKAAHSFSDTVCLYFMFSI